jgi:hypothetical protein
MGILSLLSLILLPFTTILNIGKPKKNMDPKYQVFDV